LDDFNIRYVDLGGPTMVKAAAINYKYTLPITSPCQYSLLAKYPDLTIDERLELAKSAFDYCAWYDKKII